MVFSQELRRIRSNPMARNAGWMVAGQGIGFVLQAVYFILIARLLGAYEYGIYAGAFALTGILGQYSTMGSGTLFLRYVTADPKAAPVYWGNILASTTLVSLAIMLALSVLSNHLLGAGSRPILLLAAIANCFFNQLTSCAARVFQSFEQMRQTAGLSLATNLARTAAAGAMLLWRVRAGAHEVGDHHATAYAWSVAMVAVSALAAILAVAMVTARIGWPSLSLRQIRGDLLEGFEFSFASSTSSAYNDIDKAMLGHFGMSAANGIYSLAYRVIDVATIPVLAVREAALPKFFRGGNEGIRGPARLAVSLLKRTGPVAVLAGIGVFAMAPLVPHLVGKGFAESVSALRWLCLIPLFRSVHHMTGSAITGSGNQTYRTVSQVGAAAFNFGTNVYLIPRFGWVGAAWASLMTDGLLAVVNSGMLVGLCQFERLRLKRKSLAAGYSLTSAARYSVSDSVCVQSTEPVHGKARSSLVSLSRMVKSRVEDSRSA
jgi:O-antigen/teichoic acid export membrane protein